MISYQQREFTARNHFSFTDPIHRASNDPEVGFTAWAEGMGKPGEHKGGAWARRSPQRIYTNLENGGEEFRWLAKAADDSDVPSPKLWEQSRSPATQSAKTSPVHHYSPPISRAQVIARYRQEIMDLVRDAPESAYELSLKDIVDLSATGRTGQETPEKEKEKVAEKVKEEQRQPGKKATARRMSRSESMDAGVFLLKMFSPFSLGGKRSKSAGSSGSVNSKVMPKPALGDREKGGAGRRTDGEWGNQEFGERSSGGSTNSSSISSSSRKSNGCYSFLLAPKSKATSI